MSLPNPIIQVLRHFRPLFTRPTWDKAQVLVVGTILARGRRTVTAALKQMGLHDEPDFTLFHQVLNRASGSCLTLSRVLLQLLITTFVAAGGTVEVVIDETLERRWGRMISKRGHYRDNLQSSKGQSVSTSGLRWVVMMLVVQVPWTRREWALPFFSVLATTPKVSKELGERHKTVGQIAQQMVITVRRRLPDPAMQITLVRGERFTVLGSGAVYLVDGADISYSSLSEKYAGDRVLSVYNVKVHIMADGDSFDLIRREPHIAAEVGKELAATA